MSKRKVIVPVEDQITDFFTDAPQGAAETLLRVCTRIVAKRFPLVVEVKPKSNGKGVKPVKVTKPALGQGIVKDGPPFPPPATRLDGEPVGFASLGGKESSNAS